MNVQNAKQMIWDIWQPSLAESLELPLPDKGVFHPDIEFHGFKPVGKLHGSDSVFDLVYAPMATSMRNVSRNPYVFLGGVWNGETWVATTGEFCCTLSDSLFKIPSSRNPVRLRFGEFYKVENEKIIEIRCLFDILGLAAQIGYCLLPKYRGDVNPPVGPALNNGISLKQQSESESAETLTLVENMLSGCNNLQGSDLQSMGMASFWHSDMVWHGPWGIGSCFGFEEFQVHAQGPSVASFPNRRGGFHQSRIADGLTAAFTGWPSLRGEFTGQPFRGIEPTGKPIGQNIMDFYVRRGNKLHENWVMIDLIDFAEQCGLNLLEELETSNSL